MSWFDIVFKRTYWVNLHFTFSYDDSLSIARREPACKDAIFLELFYIVSVPFEISLDKEALFLVHRSSISTKG